MDEPVYLHCDVDKMYYSVEALETPGLADETRAVIIGIDPRVAPRGIVTTANGVAVGPHGHMLPADFTDIAKRR